jgi:hypothetical protein
MQDLYYTNIFRWFLGILAASVAGISIYNLISLNSCKDKLPNDDRQNYVFWREAILIFLIVLSSMFIFLCFIASLSDLFKGREQIIMFYYLTVGFAAVSLACELLLFIPYGSCTLGLLNTWIPIGCSVVMIIFSAIAYQINKNCDCMPKLNTTLPSSISNNINPPYTINAGPSKNYFF